MSGVMRFVSLSLLDGFFFVLFVRRNVRTFFLSFLGDNDLVILLYLPFCSWFFEHCVRVWLVAGIYVECVCCKRFVKWKSRLAAARY